MVERSCTVYSIEYKMSAVKAYLVLISKKNDKDIGKLIDKK